MARQGKIIEHYRCDLKDGQHVVVPIRFNGSSYMHSSKRFEAQLPNNKTVQNTDIQLLYKQISEELEKQSDIKWMKLLAIEVNTRSHDGRHWSSSDPAYDAGLPGDHELSITWRVWFKGEGRLMDKPLWKEDTMEAPTHHAGPNSDCTVILWTAEREQFLSRVCRELRDMGDRVVKFFGDKQLTAKIAKASAQGLLLGTGDARK